MILLWARVSQGFTCLLVAINRCSAVLYPLDYEIVSPQTPASPLSSSLFSFQIWSTPIIIFCVFLQIASGSPLAVLVSRQDLLWKLNEKYATNPSINYSNVFLANEPQVCLPVTGGHPPTDNNFTKFPGSQTCF